MAQQTTTNDDGTEREPTRHDETVSGDDLVEGDRIDPALVARIPEQLGQRIVADLDGAETQLVQATITKQLRDVHHAVLVDPATETLAIATRTDRQQAMSRKESDWTVQDVGTSVAVEEAEIERLADTDNPVEDELAWVQDWAEIVLEDKAAGYFDYNDKLHMGSRTSLLLEDTEGRRATATIALEDDE